MVRTQRLGRCWAAAAVTSVPLLPWERCSLSLPGPPRRRSAALCAETAQAVSYYGSYTGDRFGGGIGRRVGVDERHRRLLPGTGVARVAAFSDTHERLRSWATAENWKKATAVHKGAYFTRTENLAQEAVVDHIRKHYVDNNFEASEPVEMALFRLEDTEVFRDRCRRTTVAQLPAVVHGVFEEEREPCVVDFANKRLGGGWLGYGCVQEEIMFIERPDFGAMCARSLLEMPDPIAEPLASPFSMEANEAWILRGAPRFAKLGWYGRTPKNAISKVTLLDPEQDRFTSPTVIAMDAIKASFETYRREHLEMMLVKAYTGFVAAREDLDFGGQELVATGSWGCGAFYNSEPVMFVVQALAANAAGVRLTYHVLGDGRRLAPAFELLEDMLLKRLSVVEALDLLAERCAEDPAWKSKFNPNGRSKK
eukprot:TRINITY_DN77087_c0_g1_i1.p1 TRINITY_DN77087_c0_g1~~TRINITY_DN77087_c0_g1_i1.p1  ORF type:complete len:424 (+),score=96.58 TRINITY_DN77087_c0_g1_i1:169-1440(+)